jgi:adenylosuccinate synthase
LDSASKSGRVSGVVPRAVAVIDLGFGDAGKGLVVDYLTRTLAATAVVRFNGGAQAGHNVVTPNGRHHTFSQIGAGSFVEGVETWTGPEVVVHPTALLLEARRLEEVGAASPLSRVYVHESAPVVTPFDQSLGRLRELARGDLRHGSCGVGIGEVAADLRQGEHVLRARDLPDRSELVQHVAVLRERKIATLHELLPELPRSPDVERELAAFEPPAVAQWTDLASVYARSVRVVDEAAWRRGLGRHRTIVFEGAQGVLLDRSHGFFPHTSAGDCSLHAANEIARALDRSLATVGVLRSYTARHGRGPLPGELRPRPPWAREMHNVDGPWQGAVRAGFLDLVMTRYALSCVGGNVDALAMTHGDRVEPPWNWIDAHWLPGPKGWERVEHVAPFATLTLEERRAQTERLSKARPITTPVEVDADEPGSDFAEQVASVLGLRLGFVSSGATWMDVDEIEGVPH